MAHERMYDATEEFDLSEDEVFDLLVEMCDALYEEKFIRTSFRVEQALDEFLVETGRVAGHRDPLRLTHPLKLSG